MIRDRLIMMSALLVVMTIDTVGQSTYAKMETLGTRDGLVSSKIYTIKQGSDRRLWIGTELGISAYDGYQFTNYQFSSSNETVGRTLCITQDHAGLIWFGGDKGLFYCKNDQVSRIRLSGNLKLAPEALLTDAAGNIWIGDINGLYRLPVEQVRSALSKDVSQVFTLSLYFRERVFGLSKDNKNNIYIGTHSGLYRLQKGGTRPELIWKNKDLNRPVRSIVALSPDSIYWNCLDSHPYQLLNGQVSSRFTNDYIGISVFQGQGRALALTTGTVGFLKDGYVEPLVRFEKATNQPVSAISDAEENIWVGSWEGLLKFRKSVFTQHVLPDDSPKETFSFLERKNGELLFGSNRGILYTKNNDRIIINKKIPPLFPLAEILCLKEDQDAVIWAGSGYQGISRFKNNRVSNWRNTGFFPDNNCESLFPDGKGNWYACTENGVTLINPKSEEPLIAHYPYQNKYIRPPELFGGHRKNDSPLWFYGSQGLFVLKNNLLVEEPIEGMPVRNLHINSIISDQKGNTWVATLGKGLLRCVQQKNKLVLQKIYNSQSGLPSDIALSVIADKNDNIWLGDYMSVSQIVNPGPNEHLTTFSEKDGLLSSYYQTLKLEQESKGRIWGLTSMGLFSFHPDSVNRNDLPPALVLNAVTAKGLDSNFAASRPVSFSHRNNTIEFHFTGICLTEPVKTRYAYRIREIDTTWTYTSSRKTNFNSLRPGHYTFELKAANNSNIWTKEPLEYRFTIRPALWQTGWFRLAALICIAALLYYLFKRRLSAIKNKANLQQQLTELEGKALRSQMNPHFIFNSLNAIQELIVTGNIDQAYQYLSSFSRLLRMVLNNSEKNLIPLSEELEMIRLQLSLESLRFKNSFTYHFETDQAAEPEMAKIPPLLLQPFVENAIWHGLRNKEGEKIIWIRIHESAGTIVIEVEDNGIGRGRAGEINKEKLGNRPSESKGTRLSQERIRLLNTQFPGAASIQITDKFSAEQEASGTIVTIQLSLNIQ